MHTIVTYLISKCTCTWLRSTQLTEVTAKFNHYIQGGMSLLLINATFFNAQKKKYSSTILGIVNILINKQQWKCYASTGALCTIYAVVAQRHVAKLTTEHTKVDFIKKRPFALINVYIA